jgi:adenylosuccinate synthase
MSGPIAVGKSTVSKLLIDEYGFMAIKTSQFLRRVADAEGAGTDRTSLQNLGDRLDKDSDFRWVVDDVAMLAMSKRTDVERWLLDAVRKRRQVEHFRDALPRVLHVHFTAPEDVLRARYLKRIGAGENAQPGPPYEVAISHENEIAARSLIHVADMVVNLAEISALAAAGRIAKLAEEGGPNG